MEVAASILAVHHGRHAMTHLIDNLLLDDVSLLVHTFKGRQRLCKLLLQLGLFFLYVHIMPSAVRAITLIRDVTPLQQDGGQ